MSNRKDKKWIKAGESWLETEEETSERLNRIMNLQASEPSTPPEVPSEFRVSEPKAQAVFPPVARCLCARVDWLRWAGRVEYDVHELAALEARAKFAADEGGRVAHRVGPYEMVIQPPNRGEIILSTEGVRVRATPRAGGGETIVVDGDRKELPGWTLEVDLQGGLLAEIGEQAALAVAWRIAFALGKVHASKFRRVDASADFVGIHIGGEDLPNFIKRSRKMPETVKTPSIRRCSVEREKTVGNVIGKRDQPALFDAEKDQEEKNVTPVHWKNGEFARGRAANAQSNVEPEKVDREIRLVFKQKGKAVGTLYMDDIATADGTVRVHGLGDIVGSIYMGKGTDLEWKWYDKTVELLRASDEKRRREYSRWSLNGWDGEQAVFRSEFSIQGEAIRELDARCEVYSWEAPPEKMPELQAERLRAMVPSLWTYLTGASTPQLERDKKRYMVARRIARLNATWWSVTYDPKKKRFYPGKPSGVRPETVSMAPDLFDNEGQPHPLRRRVAWLRLIVPEVVKSKGAEKRRTRCPVDARWTVIQSVKWFSYAEQPPRHRKHRDTGPRSKQTIGTALSQVAAKNLIPDLVHNDENGAPTGEVVRDEKRFVAELGSEDAAKEWLLKHVSLVMKASAKLIVDDLLETMTPSEAATYFVIRYRGSKARFPSHPLSMTPGIHKALPQWSSATADPSKPPPTLDKQGQAALTWQGLHTPPTPRALEA